MIKTGLFLRLYRGKGQLAAYEQLSGTETDYKHYSITNTYDLAGTLDTTKLWDGELGVTLIKALDYDMIASDAAEGLVSSVYASTETGKGDLIAKIKSKMWGSIGSIEYGASPVMTTSYTYNSLLQPTSIINTGRMELAYTYDYQGNVKTWTNGEIKTFAYDGMDRLLVQGKHIHQAG